MGCCAFGDLVRINAVMLLFLFYLFPDEVFCFVGDRLLKREEKGEKKSDY